MSKQRYSVQNIAEILISELGALEKSAQKISEAVELAKNITLKIDDSESQTFQSEYLQQLNQLLNNQKNYLSRYKIVPLWIYVITLVSWIITLFAVYYGISQHQKNNQFKAQTEIIK